VLYNNNKRLLYKTILCIRSIDVLGLEASVTTVTLEQVGASFVLDKLDKLFFSPQPWCIRGRCSSGLLRSVY